MASALMTALIRWNPYTVVDVYFLFCHIYTEYKLNWNLIEIDVELTPAYRIMYPHIFKNMDCGLFLKVLRGVKC